MKNIVNLTDKTLPQAASHPVKARTPLGENQLAITATQIAIALSALGIWQYSVEAAGSTDSSSHRRLRYSRFSFNMPEAASSGAMGA